MRIFIEDELYLDFLKRYGKETAEKIDDIILFPKNTPILNIQSALNIDFWKASDILDEIIEARDKALVKLVKKVAQNKIFSKWDLSIKYLDCTDILMLCYFSEEMGVIKRIEDDAFFVMDKEKFVFLAKFLWFDNKYEILEKWKNKQENKERKKIKKLVEKNANLLEIMKNK